MTDTARERARTLELVIRAAVAEEHLLARRLARAAEEQRQTRQQIERELRHEHYGQPLNGNGWSSNGNGRPPSAGR